MNKRFLVGISLPAVAGLGWMAISSVARVKAPVEAAPAPRASLEVTASPPVPAPRAEATSRRVAPSAPSAVPPVSAVDPASEPDPARMRALQDLLTQNPAAALEAAREGLAQYPRSPDAAERTWVVVKALTVIGRAEEAQLEAEAMNERFRGTRWANDVERHVLVHP